MDGKLKVRYFHFYYKCQKELVKTLFGVKLNTNNCIEKKIKFVEM